MSDTQPHDIKKRISSDEVMSLVSKYKKKVSVDHGALQKEIRLLYNLLEAIKNLNELHELDSLLADIADKAVSVCGAEKGFVYFKSGKEEKMVARTNSGVKWVPAQDGYSESVLEQVLTNGKRLILDEDEHALISRKSVFDLALRSIACFPLIRDDIVCGALYVHSREGKSFGSAELRTLGALSEIATAIIRSTEINEENNQARKEISRLNAQLQNQVNEQKEEINRTREAFSRQSSMFKRNENYGGIFGISAEISKTTELLKSLEATELPVLISGESGTGKELVARAIHANSKRADGSFLAVNCGALPDSLLSAELFGYKKGAFTGATQDRRGLFELAHKGTLFLDEVVSMSTDMQKSLLRVLERGEIHPLGSEKKLQVDVRVIAAANKDVKKLVAEGSFREDLYYRLAVVTVFVPPLRTRLEDIALLVEHFSNIHENPNGVTFSPKAITRLQSYNWPGNVRQLENEIRRTLALGKGEIQADFFSHLEESSDIKDSRMPASIRIADLEKWAIQRALTLSGGQKVKAAELLGIPRRTLYEKLKKIGL